MAELRKSRLALLPRSVEELDRMLEESGGKVLGRWWTKLTAS